MEGKRLNFFRDVIVRERKQLLQSVRGIDKEISDYLTERPIEYNERGEGESVMVLLSRLDYRQRKELSLMEQALAKIRSGTYGICLLCGKSISEDRLLAIPYASACKVCAGRWSASERE